MTTLLRENVPWNPVKDFAPIALAVSAPNIVVVHPSPPVKSIKDLVALAKAKPGVLNYASGATGATSHLAPELFKAMAGINIVHIPYKGAGAALNGLMGTHVQVMFPTAGSVIPHVKAGRLRALAVTGAQPPALAPGVPTVAASGLPGYESVAPYGVMAPARTPHALINRLNKEIVHVLGKSDVQERFFSVGVEVVGSSPEQLGQTIKSDMEKWGKVIKDAGIRGG